ncbi:MAG: PDZ domain-containing protein [Bacteroidales bacterium]|jgi:C-terminal processing protease CtpA/Prc|nr:PDZ domain-containing protein [Bacteroidales bacterium]
MKDSFVKYLKTAAVTAGLSIMLLSCDKDSDNNNNNNVTINNWILENMSTYYLWEQYLPSRTDKSLSPDAYFESLLYSEDRFSWIQDDFLELINMLAGIVKEAGYDYWLSRVTANSSSVAGIITYIKPGSPAEQAGLKRGDIFLTVNGQQLTDTNYGTLTNEMDANHTLGIYREGELTPVALTVVEYEENPILLDTVYVQDDKKTGYLIYNFFASDNNDGTMCYDKQLNDIFGRFKETGIDELILDFRYNSGGSVSSAVALASMISGCTARDIFSIEQYNAIVDAYFQERYGKNYNKIPFIDAITLTDSNDKVIESTPINHLGMERLYVLTSGRTASASEMIINALNPYLNGNIVLIGETTVGKNVGSFTFYEDDPVKQQTNKWGMQPIVMRIANKDGFSEYSQGFEPDVKVHELDDDSLKPLGDTEELMLKTALDHIAGRSRASRKNFRRWEHIGSSADRTKARGNIIKSREDFKYLK